MHKLFILTLFCSTVGFGGFGRTEGGARQQALSNASCGLADDAWAIFCNVGGVAQLRHPEVSFSYSPQPFGLPELSTAAAVLVYPTSQGVFGVAGRRYGFDLYREVTGAISYANTFSSLHAGVTLSYHSVSIKNYGTAGALGIDAGVLVRIVDRWRWGLSIRNLNSPTIGISRASLPQSFTTGMSYEAADGLRLALDINKETGFDLSPRFGFEYWIADALALRGGMSGEPSQFSGGAGFRVLLFQVDYAFTTHEDLGGTYQITLTVR